MRTQLVILAFSLLCNTSRCWHSECRTHDVIHPFLGHYCPADGIITTNLSWHQCKLFCLYTSSCQAVNYNFTDNLCTHYTATCPKATSSSDMAFALLTGIRQEQCIEWIPKENGHPERDRYVTEDNERYAIRMQKDGADYIGHLIINTCYSRDGEGSFMDRGGYPCQYLRIRDGCTVVFVNYEIGAPVPPSGLIGGYTAEGIPVYIGLEHRNPRYGYHIAGSNSLVNADKFITGNVRLLVAL